MSLLDNASLLLTPNAYKEGKLYSVIPSNGNGDFTATRATTATRVNSAGLVDLVPYNLVQRSEEFENAYWTKINGNTLSNTTTAPNGTLTADSFTKTSGINTVSDVFVSPFLTTGVHTLSLYIKPNIGNSVLLRLDRIGNSANAEFNFTTKTFVNSGANILSSSFVELDGGWFRLIVTANVIASNWQISACNLFSNPIGDSMFLWGAQLVEGTSARDYLRTETRLNIPRVDYSLGGCPNILLEPQRTNLALQSSSFDSASWGKNAVSITANSTTSPSGIVDADTLTGDGTSNRHEVTQSVSVTNGVAYTFSIYAKKGTNNFIQFFPGAASFGTTGWANFDLDAGVVGSVGASTTATITAVGNGWYRCTTTATATFTTSTVLSISLVNSATAPRSQTNTLNTSVFLWGVQYEAGAYATSYIPTTTASVTRNADSITRNNIFTNGLITASGGTWFVELRGNFSLERANFPGGLFINTGTISNQADGLLLRSSANPSRISINKVIGGTTSQLYQLITDTAKLAIKWNGSTADVFVNGVKQVSATAFTTTAMQNLIGEGQNRQIFVNEMALFPTPLTDAQCLALTA